jgi:heme A synthase
MVTFADKRAAIGAAWMALAAVVMLGAGIVATGIPLLVAGLFLITAVPCALVAVSLFLVARRGRGEEQPVSADAVQAASEEVDPVPASTE